MDAFTKDMRRDFTKYTGAVPGIIFCLQMVLWVPPAFTGTLQDVEKQGEKAAEGTENAAGKALHDTQKSGGKAIQDTEKAAGKALQGTEKAGAQGFQDVGKSLKGTFDGKKSGYEQPSNIPAIGDGAGGSPQGLAGGSNATSTGGFQPSNSGGGSSLSPSGASYPTYSDPTSTSQPMREVPKAPDFSLQSSDPGMQGSGSWYEKLGSSGTALPPGSQGQGLSGTPTPFSQGGVGQGIPGTAFPQGSQGSMGQGAFGPSSSQSAPRPGGPPVPFSQDTTGR
jgi:hypothetical protein